ncbi:MAG: hypothetical protein HY554_05020, partial [Elusimicrobia bacterium]|nr:hypothetical protein [Elusimicrobiota bacterium]
VHYGPFEDAVRLVAERRLPLADLVGGFGRLEDYAAVLAEAKDGERRKPFFLIDEAHVRDHRLRLLAAPR